MSTVTESTIDSSNMCNEILDETNLYVKNLWSDCTQTELDDLFKSYGIIQQSIIHESGIGFVRFQEPEAAKKAILEMHNTLPDDRCHRKLIVKYAKKNHAMDTNIDIVHPINTTDNNSNNSVEGNAIMVKTMNTNNVYLRNLPKTVTRKKLRKWCQPYGNITSINLIKTTENNYAFVRYENATDAMDAIHALHGKRIGNINTNFKILFAKLANNDVSIGNNNVNTNNNIDGEINLTASVKPTMNMNNNQTINTTMISQPISPTNRYDNNNTNNNNMQTMALINLQLLLQQQQQQQIQQLYHFQQQQQQSINYQNTIIPMAFIPNLTAIPNCYYPTTNNVQPTSYILLPNTMNNNNNNNININHTPFGTNNHYNMNPLYMPPMMQPQQQKPVISNNNNVFLQQMALNNVQPINYCMTPATGSTSSSSSVSSNTLSTNFVINSAKHPLSNGI